MSDPFAPQRAAIAEVFRVLHAETQRDDIKRKTFEDFLQEASSETREKLTKVDGVANRLLTVVSQLKQTPPDASLVDPTDNVFFGDELLALETVGA